jgi:dipeptidyl aminopeptidase/acylaminoacyl peptidase
MKTFGRLAFILALGATTAHAARPIGPDDIARIRTVGDPQVAPDGAWVAYTISESDVAADKNVSHLWMSRWDGSRTVQLTGRKSESENTPRFSPDGQYLAFISSRGDSHDDDQLWLMDRTGGEGVRLPGIKGSVGDIAWSPDSKTIALIVQDPDPDEKANAAAQAATASPAKPGAPTPPTTDAAVAAPAAEAGATEKGDDKKPRPIVIDRFQFKQDIDGYLGTRRSRIWLYDLATHSARRLTTGDYDEALPAWSPDGRSIAFTSKRLPDPDRSYDSNLFVAAVGTQPTEPRALTSFVGADNDAEWSSYPAWSPDGRRIAYLQGGPVELFSYGVQSLAVVDVADGAPTILTGKLDRNVHDPIWSADGRAIRFVVEDDGVERIAEIAASGGAPKSVVAGFRVFSSPAAAPRGGLAVLVSTPATPAELYALDRSGALRQLSHANDAWLKDVAIAPVARTALTSKDGTEVHGFTITPPGAVAGKPLPTVLFNHGGPQSQFNAGFNMNWQIFAGHGFAVVSTNPRGSTGRGEAFAKALYADWGGPAVPDALAGVDDAVRRGIADPARLFVGGWSYGGMLTDYLIASDTRFKAAVSGASIGNALAGYGTDQYIRDYEMELGTPWTSLDRWMKISYPFFHNDRIVTPTLFMVGDKDFNVPHHNSEQLYQALSSRGISTRLIIYPGQYHGLKRPSFLKDRMERWLDWYDRGGVK